jgi:hypothetical protein
MFLRIGNFHRQSGSPLTMDGARYFFWRVTDFFPLNVRTESNELLFSFFIIFAFSNE